MPHFRSEAQCGKNIQRSDAVIASEALSQLPAAKVRWRTQPCFIQSAQ
jgi:hypothetical protein